MQASPQRKSFKLSLSLLKHGMRQLVIHINDLKPAKIGSLDEAFWHTRHFLHRWALGDTSVFITVYFWATADGIFDRANGIWLLALATI